VLYLLIMVVVAAAGITRLWLMQRRQRALLQTVDGFRSSLERISEQTRARPAGVRRPSRAHAAGPRHAPRRPRPQARGGSIDPARRAAAKRRIEARRRARARAAR
jgi:hypothetical protein